MTDEEIIDLFFERSEQAITQLEMKYGTICKQIATNILKNEEDAKECVNDAHSFFDVHIMFTFLS